MSIPSRSWGVLVVAAFLWMGGCRHSGQAEEKERRFCGGIAAIPCPEGLVCVDDPRDECHPSAGGADCGGICVASDAQKPDACSEDPTRRYISRNPEECARIRFFCEPGTAPFSDVCGCGCELSS